MRRERVQRMLFVAVLLTAAPAAAQWREWENEFDEDKKGWRELEARLPPHPKPENLARIKTGSASGHEFYVDTASVTVGEDGVTRYTAVIKTSGGATNTLFEGMRCETREEKLYAIGRTDGGWARARNPKWQRVVLRELVPYRHTLYHDFFCASGAKPTPVSQVVDALKRGSGFRTTAVDD
jgi:hypothetical protein